MKQFLYSMLLIAAIGSFMPRAASAQCTYTANLSPNPQGGRFSDKDTWTVNATGNSPCSGTPVSGSDAIIIIGPNIKVQLDVPYIVGRNGSIKIGMRGLLYGGTDLTVGDGTANLASTRLTIEPGGALQVGRLVVNKGTVMVSAAYVAQSNSTSIPTTLTTDCNLVLSNAIVTVNSLAYINGSVDISSGAANNVLCGTGSVRITGCVFGGNGALKRLAENCASTLNLNVCAQLNSVTGCPGPVAGNNADQRACDSLVPLCGPLPVELVIFTASLTARQGVALHWVTASEKNSQYFAIERSADGTSFSTLRTVAAAGTTSARTTYNHTDEQPLFGTSYYRLRQVDTDGTTAFSPVQLIRLGSANAEGLAVYPGGEAQQWVVSSALPAAVLASGPASVRVFDALGRSQRVAAVPDGSQTGRWTLDMRTLPAGMYIVRLVSAAGSFSQRVVQ